MSNYLTQSHDFVPCTAQSLGCGFPVLVDSINSDGSITGKFDIQNMTSGQLFRALSYKDVMDLFNFKAH